MKLTEHLLEYSWVVLLSCKFYSQFKEKAKFNWIQFCFYFREPSPHRYVEDRYNEPQEITNHDFIHNDSQRNNYHQEEVFYRNRREENASHKNKFTHQADESSRSYSKQGQYGDLRNQPENELFHQRRNSRDYPYKNEFRKSDNYVRPDSSNYHKEEFESSGYGSSATQVSYEQKRYVDNRAALTRDGYNNNTNLQRGYRLVY